MPADETPSTRRTPLRVGIVGLGWGTFVHVPAFRAVPDYEVVALCARRPEALAQAAERTGIGDTSTDWRRFVERDDLDLIAVATPVSAHHEITIGALQAGKHVLCEKPSATTAAQAREMADTARRLGRVAANAFELRWMPMRRRIWQLAGDGYLGDPYFLRISQAMGVAHPSRPAQAAWMYDLAEGGGFLNASVSHDIDFVRAALGEIVSVCADVRAAVPTRVIEGRVVDVDADDTDVLLLRLATGALAVLTWTAAGLHAAGEDLEVYGSAGTIRGSGPGVVSSGRGPRPPEVLLAGTLDDAGLSPIDVDDRQPRTRPDLPPGRFSSACIRALALMLEDWLPAFDGIPTPVPTLDDGWFVQHVIEAARASSAGAGWVDVAPSP